MPGALSFETAGDVHSVAVLLVAHCDAKLTLRARRQLFFAPQQASRQAEVHELDRNRPDEEPSFHVLKRSIPDDLAVANLTPARPRPFRGKSG